MLKELTDKDWSFLSRLPKAEKERLDAAIIQEQKWRRGLLSVHQIGELLNLGKDGVNNLPVKFIRPFRKTHRGWRQVKSLHKDDLTAFLYGLNASFADYDPDEGALLSPAQAAEKYGEELPEFVQLSGRTRRYRAEHQQSIADMIMGVKHGD